MKIMQETTEWTDGANANHIYIFKKFHPRERAAMAIGYIPRGKDRVVKFRIPLQIDTKNRTFEELK